MDAQAHKACSTTTSEKGSVVRGRNRHIQARNIEEPLSEELNQGYEGVQEFIAFAVESYLEDKLTRTELRKPLEQADPDRSSGTHNAYSTE